jgi:hypothetical protein
MSLQRRERSSQGFDKTRTALPLTVVVPEFLSTGGGDGDGTLALMLTFVSNNGTCHASNRNCLSLGNKAG